MLLLFRVIQGAGGGGLQPMAQAILADTFPPQKRGLAFALYGITAIMAPTIGLTCLLTCTIFQKLGRPSALARFNLSIFSSITYGDSWMGR
jgi:MFS family permease